MQNLCEEESARAILCPVGYYCPDVTRKVKCPTLTSSPLTPTHPNLPPQSALTVTHTSPNEIEPSN